MGRSFIQILWVSALILGGCSGGGEVTRAVTVPAAASVTAVPSKTLTATATVLPSVNPSLAPTPTTTMVVPTSGEVTLKKIIAVIDMDEQLNLVGEDLKTFRSYPDNYFDTSYDPDSCSITGFRAGKARLEIGTLKFEEEEIHQEFALFVGEIVWFDTYNFTVSPDHHWIAYKQITGEYGMSIESARIQDVYLMEVDSLNASQPIQLTTHGGAWPSEISWSPDGRYLAFTDFDQNGIPQVFLYEPSKGEKIQLTSFGTELAGRLISDYLKWSPSSAMLFFSTEMNYKGDTNELRIGVINISDTSVEWIEIPAKTGVIDQIYWGRNGEKFMMFLTGSYPSKVYILWVDVVSKAIIHNLTFDINYIQRNQAFPITDDLDKVVIFSWPVQIYTLSQDSSIEVNSSDTSFDERFELLSSSSGFTWSSDCYVRP